MGKYIIRFGYCPPSPGPKAKITNKWFNNINDALEAYNGEILYIKYNNLKYRRITLDELLKLITE